MNIANLFFGLVRNGLLREKNWMNIQIECIQFDTVSSIIDIFDKIVLSSILVMLDRWGKV